MNATTASPSPAPSAGSPLARAYGRLPPSLWQRLATALRWPVVAALLLGSLALFSGAFYIYLRAGFAWRYLFPGMAGMAIFIAFPLIYTAQIGFTNYSSAHLLSQDRVRAYLLDQHEVIESGVLALSLHGDGPEYRIVLSQPETAQPRYVSPPLALKKTREALKVTMLAARDEHLPLQSPLQPALPLRELIPLREALAQLQLLLPDRSGPAAQLRYLGLREFGPVSPHYLEQADGSLLRVADGQAFVPDRQQGYYRAVAGAEILQPGFKVLVGLQNYSRMLFDAEFRGPFVSIFIWTVLFSLATVAGATFIGMFLAVLLNWEDLKGRSVYRTLLFLPYAVPGFISILVFKGLFNQNFGEINAILDALFDVKPAWFADPLLAKLMLLIVNIWLGYPYIMILCSGLLKAIPADLYEASAIVGAGPWTNFRRITAPLIIKPLAPLLISAFAFNFNNFVLIALLTDGRPDFLSTKLPAGQTDILVSYTYRIAFRDSGSDFGLAAAISTLIFVLVAAMSLLNLRLMRKAQG